MVVANFKIAIVADLDMSQVCFTGRNAMQGPPSALRALHGIDVIAITGLENFGFCFCGWFLGPSVVDFTLEKTSQDCIKTLKIRV